MTRFRRLLALPFKDKLLLAEAFLCAGLTALALRFLPYCALRHIFPEARGAVSAAEKASRIAWAVSLASRYLSGATCLIQALAAQSMLARRDIPSHLQIGVTRDQQGPLRAHAWLESGERVVIGGSGLERYAPLSNGIQDLWPRGATNR